MLDKIRRVKKNREQTTYFIAILRRNSKLPEVGSRGAQTAIVPDIINNLTP